MKSFHFAVLSLCLGVSVLFAGCGGGSSSSSGSGSGGNTVPPTVTSISPATTAAGSEPLTLTVNGTGFLSTTTIQVGGVVDATTYVSSTKVTATVSASQLATGGNLSVIALNGTASSASGTAVNLEVTNPSPAISATTPAVVTVGTAATVVAVAGTGFVPATVIDVNGSARPTTFTSGTQVNVTLSLADVSAAGSLSLTAVNPTPGGGTSAAQALTVNYPLPRVFGMSPNPVLTTATAPVTITINGTGFVPVSTVQTNSLLLNPVGGSAGVARPTTFVSSTQLTFQLTASDLAQVQEILVTVVNPTPGGGTASAGTLNVANPSQTPVITQVSPTTFVAGSSDTLIQVYGNNLYGTGVPLLSTTTVQWNGTALATVSGSSFGTLQTITATVPASLLASAGTAAVTVANATATPSTSNAITVTISTPPAPTLTSISPSAGPINTATQITLNGTGFTSSSTVAVNGTNVTATYGNSSQLTVNLPASAVALPGNLNIAVTTPAPGGGTSSSLPYTAYIAIPNNSMVYSPADGMFYVSVPSSAGAPYGNSVVSVVPETGALGTPILVGSEPNKLAISSDGKTLWVGLDGASAVREVNLVTGTAGLQFPLGGNGGVYQSPGTALALAALPGSPDSVVVATQVPFIYEGSIAIFDKGVIRGTGSTSNGNGIYYSLLADSAHSEIYAGGSSYSTFTFGASGLTPLASSSSGFTYANNFNDEMQIAGGRLYNDFGQVFDSESGSLLGTFYLTETTVDSGSTTADTTLGKAFVLANPQYSSSSSSTSQINVFNLSDFTSTSTSIPVSWVSGSSQSYNYSTPTRLTRWGTNGLAFRTAAGVFSVRSNLVKDLSSVNADLGVSLAASGGTTTGTNTTYTATITNAGPSAATNVALTATLPASAVLVSLTPSAGTCWSGGGISCNLGGIASGASATVSIVAEQLTAGSATLNAQVSGSETDPNAANNSASASVQVTGSTYSLVPALSGISPAAIESGSGDTTITLTGSGFSSGATVQFGATTLVSAYTGGSTLTATIPASDLTNLGWAPITVTNPGPGGGTSNALPVSIYSVMTLGVNHILYDPYSRKIMASVGSGSSSVSGNSIAAIDPETAAIGTPVSIGSQPENMALTSDGQILYTILAGSQSVARFNMLTQTADYTYAIPNIPAASGIQGVRGVATQPGTENTVNLDLGSWAGNAIFDFDPPNKTAAIRGQASGPYSGSCVSFLDAANMLAFDTDTSGATLDHYTVTSAGFTYYDYQQYTESTLNSFGCFKLSGGLAFANAGGVANPATLPATQIGVYKTNSGGGTFSTASALAPDTSLKSTFFAVDTTSDTSYYSSLVDGIESFDQNTFLPSNMVSLNMQATEGNNSYSVVDLVRWGQDGLAALSSGGHIYFLRGAFVVPQLLTTNTAATLTSSSISSVAHGSGNVLLTLTGTNFLPGVAVTWNGSYRTTTIVNATHVTVAIPASDLAAAGSGSLKATNPGAPASNPLTITIN